MEASTRREASRAGFRSEAAEEHRSTLDWLNRITDESFRFFGFEVELWKIGESPAAPKFNVISKPNDWSQSVAQAARAIDEADLSETRTAQKAYWTGLNRVLNAAAGPVSGNRKPQPQSWMAYPIGRTFFALGAVMVRPKNQIRTELYISGGDAKRFFGLLRAIRSRSNASSGTPWSGRSCRPNGIAGSPAI